MDREFQADRYIHALVISGAHVLVLAGVLMFLLRICAIPELAALTVTAGPAAWLYACPAVRIFTSGRARRGRIPPCI